MADEFGWVNVREAISASSSRTETSTPIIAAGTRPNALKALNLPPTFGSAFTTRNPEARAEMSSGEFGSVTTTI